MDIEAQLRSIEAEPDLVEKALRLAFLVSAVFAEAGRETVIVGGSAIEFFTDGDYMSGDLDVCFTTGPRPRAAADRGSQGAARLLGPERPQF